MSRGLTAAEEQLAVRYWMSSDVYAIASEAVRDARNGLGGRSIFQIVADLEAAGWQSQAHAKIEGLREALAFYADPKSWDRIHPERGTVTSHYPAAADAGEIARTALRLLSGGTEREQAHA
jgi:hypothetical protein